MVATVAGREFEAQLRCDYCHLPVPRRRSSDPPAETDRPLYCCYGCRLAADITQARGATGQATWMLTRLGLALFFSMAVMVFSMYLYGQEIHGASGTPASSGEATLTGLMRYLSLLFATPVFFILGLPILTNAVIQFRNRVVSVDALVVLGVAAAFAYSYVSTLTEQGSTYYETACMILVLVTFGRWLEAMGKLKASRAVEDLESLIPDQVAVVRDGESVRIRSEDVRVGDTLTVASGQRIAADGVIEEGRANVDEQLITGESTPVAKAPGDVVRAGTINTDGMLGINVTAVGAESTIGRLIALLEAAKNCKAGYEILADRIATGFVPATLILACVGGVLGYVRGGADQGIMSGLAVMLIACPCALGIATPTAIWVALGRAAREGVLFRNGETIESLASVRAICFDKTGTLTTGEPTVSSFMTMNASTDGEREALARACGLGRGSNHVLSNSIARYAGTRGVEPTELRDVRVVPGRGMQGTAGDANIFLGSRAWMRDNALEFAPRLREASETIASNGSSLSCIGWGRQVRGVFEFSETLRNEAATAMHELTSLGCTNAVLTGDHAQRGAEIGRALGVQVRAELSPKDKIEEIARIRGATGPVAMVGDGLNDAPALASADVGIAMGCGADITRESADLCLLGNDLGTLPWVIGLARRTVRTIKQNLFWAFIYNVIGMGLALSGRLSPIFAAGAMVISSLLVVGNSLRLDRYAVEEAG